jgi:prepilin-type processing-associated H-X9-DG protein
MVQYNCVHCGKAIEVNEVFAGTSGACPFCGQTDSVPGIRTSSWAVASLVCGLLGCLVLPAILAIPFGIIGIRQVNRSGGRVKGRGLAIAGLVMGGLYVLLVPTVFYPAVDNAIHSANHMNCNANLRSIGQALHIYASQNNGHWPTVYSYPAAAGERWGPGFDPETGEIADRGTKKISIDQHGPFTCNVSAWWLPVRAGMASPPVFNCPETTMDVDWADDSMSDPTRWWSFKKIDYVSYSYQNQLGRNTTDRDDSRLIVAADRNPCRGDCTEAQKGIDPRKRWLMNSPNHDFHGQNCLYADGHVEFNTSPDCGIRHNNIWLRSTGTDSAGSAVVEDTASYADGTSQPGDQTDSFLAP